MGNDSSKQVAAQRKAGGAVVTSPNSAVAASAAIGAGVEAPIPLIIEEHSRGDADDKKPAVSLDDFELLRVIGRGSFGKVYLARALHTGEILALKVMTKQVLQERGQLDHVRQERLILESLHHPFVISLKYAFHSRDKIFLATPFCSGGELFHWLKIERCLPEARVRLYAAELVLALEYMHDRGIIYRDLKPENILLDSTGHVQLTDFGLSKQARRAASGALLARTFCGTPEYLAPETLLGQAEGLEYGTSVDWWALGVILWELLHGLPPFYDTDHDSMYAKITAAKLPPRAPHISAATYELLAGLLCREVPLRLGRDGAGRVKSHAFFSGINWDSVLHKVIAPSFVPPTNGVMGADGGNSLTGQIVVSNFDDEFTEEEPAESVPAGRESRLASNLTEGRGRVGSAGLFEGFTFVDREDAGGLHRDSLGPSSPRLSHGRESFAGIMRADSLSQGIGPGLVPAARTSKISFDFR